MSKPNILAAIAILCSAGSVFLSISEKRCRYPKNWEIKEPADQRSAPVEVIADSVTKQPTLYWYINESGHYKFKDNLGQHLSKRLTKGDIIYAFTLPVKITKVEP